MVHIDFSPSNYSPIAISFAGLSIGYMIMGGQALFKYPPEAPGTERTLGIWAVAMPGVIQSVSAFVLFVGMTWFGVFKSKPYSYFLIVAFMAYATHWFAMGWTRYVHADKRLEGWMAVPLLLISALGAWVMAAVPDVPIAIAFALLACIYAADAIRGFHPAAWSMRLQGAVQFATAWWLMYLVWAIVLTYTKTGTAWI